MFARRHDRRLRLRFSSQGRHTDHTNANSSGNYPGYSGITQQENTTNGNVQRIPNRSARAESSWGLSGELDYTWSHEIDIQTYDNTCCVSNPWYLKYDKGSGFLDRRNILSANYIYNCPFFAKSNGLVHSIAGGWEIAGTIADVTGVPTASQYGGSDDHRIGRRLQQPSECQRKNELSEEGERVV